MCYILYIRIFFDYVKYIITVFFARLSPNFTTLDDKKWNSYVQLKIIYILLSNYIDFYYSYMYVYTNYWYWKVFVLDMYTLNIYLKINYTLTSGNTQ